MTHPQTQMLQFAIAEIGWKETYDQSWKEIIQFYSKGIGDGVGGHSDLQIGEGRIGAIAGGNVGEDGAQDDGKADHGKAPGGVKKKKAAGGAGGDGKVPGQDPKDPNADPNEKKAKEDAKIVAKALSTKKNLVNASHQAIQILDQIKTRENTDFFWADGNLQGEKRIQGALDQVRGSMTDLMRTFVLSDAKAWAKVKNRFSPQQILEELRRFNEKENDIKALADANTAIIDVTARLAGH